VRKESRFCDCELLCQWKNVSSLSVPITPIILSIGFFLLFAKLEVQYDVGFSTVPGGVRERGG